ncbi:MAG: peroxiredoxin [Gammaproteobacteria bacterium]|jgi:peroxiredoxin|tara:strand:- start:78 stop:563 length:486 start_codon:yes stop_codon:yes gene_type:complete
MTISAGDKMPSGTLTTMTADGPKPVSTDELFAGKKVVLFSVPGAFTPTCSMKHLPGFVAQAEALKAQGVDTVVCTAVNDVFVMSAWGKSANADGKVLMAADGNGDYVRSLGLELDASGFGMGKRGQRFSVVVDNGVATHVNIEGPGEFTVSNAETALSQTA